MLLNVSVGKIKIGLQANAGLHTYRQRNVYLSVGFSYLCDDPKPSTSTVILGDLIKQWLHQGRLFLDIGDIEDLRLCDRIKCKMCSGLHKLWYPGIRDTSTWSKFGAHGEHGDVVLFSNLGAL